MKIMKEYYYEKNGQKLGPLSKQELKGKISKDSLIWKYGMEDWTKAAQLPELNDLFRNEPPPIPGYESKNSNQIEKVNLYAVLLFLMTIAAGVMEYLEMEDNRIYSILLTGTIVATFQVLRSIKKYLNDDLNFNETNKDLNILIVTTIICGVGAKFLSKLEEGIIPFNLSENAISVFVFILIIAISVTVYYYLRLGKKLSKIGHELASRISKFAYTTLISLAISIVLFIMFENKTAIVLTTIVTAIPLLYLIIGFNNSKEQVGYV